ncbi:hypothetical protein ACLOJK_010426 [Asimina triloba]
MGKDSVHTLTVDLVIYSLLDQPPQSLFNRAIPSSQEEQWGSVLSQLEDAKPSPQEQHILVDGGTQVERKERSNRNASYSDDEGPEGVYPEPVPIIIGRSCNNPTKITLT